MKGMVRKLPDGRWEGRVELPPDKDGKRKRKYVYADKRAECQRKVNELVYQLECSDFADAGRLTVDAYMKQWFSTYCISLAASTQQGYENYVFNHINPYFAGFRLKSLKPIHIEEFYNSERRKYKEKTILQIHRIFSNALKDAVKNNLITKNACQLVKAPSPDPYEPDIPDLDHYFLIVDAARGTEHEIPVLLAGMCGLRRSEVFGMTWNDIDFKQATLTVRQALVTVKKGLDEKKTKSRTSTRTISIPDNVLEVLKAHKNVGYVASRNGKASHPGNYSHRFANFLKRNKITHIRFHDLRHFHATLLLDAGVPLRHAQGRLGHSTITMTAHYQHLRKKSDAVVIDKIDTFIRKSKKAPDVHTKTKQKK